MSNIECPYCGEDCGLSDENFSEGEYRTWDCPSCKKEFEYTCQYDVDYPSRKKQEAEK